MWPGKPFSASLCSLLPLDPFHNLTSSMWRIAFNSMAFVPVLACVLATILQSAHQTSESNSMALPFSYYGDKCCCLPFWNLLQSLDHGRAALDNLICLSNWTGGGRSEANGHESPSFGLHFTLCQMLYKHYLILSPSGLQGREHYLCFLDKKN